MTAAVIWRFHTGFLGGWRGHFGLGVCGNNTSLLMNGITVTPDKSYNGDGVLCEAV